MFSEKLKLLILVSLINYVSSRLITQERRTSARDPRLFAGDFFIPMPGFPILIPSPPLPQMGTMCTANSNLLEAGQCLTVDDCNAISGGKVVESKMCGAGICCLIEMSWDNYLTPGRLTVTRNLSTLMSSNTGKATSTTFRIPKMPGVRQLKLEFQQFAISQPNILDPTLPPNSPGDCRKDKMIITGAKNLLSSLIACGEMKTDSSIQHLYLHYSDNDDPEVISVSLFLIDPVSKYRILVTMIRYDSTERAPPDCTQHYTHAAGQVRSLNFPAQQLNNQMYTICVGGNGEETNSIVWATCTDNPSDFFISGSDEDNFLEDCTNQDKIIISNVEGEVGVKEYCGGIFNPVESNNQKPFKIDVEFDKSEFMVVAGSQKRLQSARDMKCPPDYVCHSVVLDPGSNTTTYVPKEEGDCSDDPSIEICIFTVTDDSQIQHDTHNSGFCLQYTTT